MTIYTAKSTEKKDEEKEAIFPQVVTENLGEKKEKEPAVVPTLITVTSRRHRHSACTNLCVLLTAFLVLATGIIGGVYLYKHLAHRTFRGWCGVRYYEYQNQGRKHGHHTKHMGHFEERVELDKTDGAYEKLDVPAFDECKRATIVHDFEKNLTAIIDKDEGRCFVMKLNRSMVAPPQDFYDLLNKIQTGYYIPNARVVRQEYRVIHPAINNLTPMGFYIWNECHGYDTYKLKKMRSHRRGKYRRHQRSAESVLAYSLGASATKGNDMTELPIILLHDNYKD